jgi:hypothetical protein
MAASAGEDALAALLGVTSNLQSRLLVDLKRSMPVRSQELVEN